MEGGNVSCRDIFKGRFILPPSRFRVLDYPRKPVAVFNPGAVLWKDKIHVFPRLIFDYYKYTSSIGHFTLDPESLILGYIPDVIDVEIVMWPKGREDLLGVEDPRAHLVDDEVWILYTAKGFDRSSMERRDYLGFAVYDGKGMERRGYFRIDLGRGPFFPVSNKDSTFLRINGREADILTRPDLGGELSLWRGKADLEEMVIRDMRIVKGPSEDEEKLGWSTNAIDLEGKWLVGWHSVMKGDLSYRNGFALIDDEGEKFSEHVLCPKGLVEEYGDRALVIFGCGLLRMGENVVWIGGVSDYAIGIFIAGLGGILGVID